MRTREWQGKKYQISDAHPATELFPWIDDHSLEELIGSIRENGLFHPIVRLPDGRIVAGRNREFACLIAGVKPLYIDQPMEEEQAIRFVMAEDITRRHLTKSQRAQIAAGLANLLKGQRKIQIGKIADLEEKAHEIKVTQAEAAQKLGVSERSVRSAAAVARDAPDMIDLIRDGKVTLSTAEAMTEMTKAARARVARSQDIKKAARKELAKARAEQLAKLPPVRVEILITNTATKSTLWKSSETDPKKAIAALRTWVKANR